MDLLRQQQRFGNQLLQRRASAGGAVSCCPDAAAAGIEAIDGVEAAAVPHGTLVQLGSTTSELVAPTAPADSLQILPRAEVDQLTTEPAAAADFTRPFVPDSTTEPRAAVRTALNATESETRTDDSSRPSKSPGRNLDTAMRKTSSSAAPSEETGELNSFTLPATQQPNVATFKSPVSADPAINTDDSSDPTSSRDRTEDLNAADPPTSMRAHATPAADIVEEPDSSRYRGESHAPFSSTAAASETLETTSASKRSPAALIVTDSAARLRPGQMKRTEFLAEVRAEVVTTVEEIIAPTGRSTADCPYLDFLFSFLARRSARYVDQLLRRFLPEASAVDTAEDAIPYITERVRRSAMHWLHTTQITGLPEGVPQDIRTGLFAARLGSNATVPGSVFFKEKAGGPRVPSDPQAIQSQLGMGNPLAFGVRSRMESAFGHDFSHVRLHTDGVASALSNRLNARAFTVGGHVAFAAGEYQPGTLIGDALIAHELAHVVQQAGAVRVSDETDGCNDRAFEQDADAAASGAIALLWGGGLRQLAALTRYARPRLRAGLRLQRCRNSGTSTASTVSITPNPENPTAALMVAPWVTAAAGPVHHSFGAYQEYIGWSTTGRSGFIVQEVNNTYTVKDCATGTPNTAVTPTAQYWEAWAVDSSGSVTPTVGAVNDMWIRPQRPSTEGKWAMDAQVYWVSSLDSAAGFASKGVPDAAILLATTTPPTNLGTSLLTRHAGGEWDCTGAHTAK